jgi:pilus retraction protein PilT
MSIIRDLLARAVELGASDVHITTGQQPCFRLHGNLSLSEFEALDAASVRQIVDDIVPPHARRQLDATHESDFSFNEDGVGRFRVNAFYGKGEPAIAMRYVKDHIPTIEELGLPPILETFADVPRGIVILSGPTGCGKSTSLASLIDTINRKHRRRIITIEDPIEYAFRDEQSVVTQREVGLDTLSFASGLRQVLRQDPDVILIGEIRDAETLRIAVRAAETGHLIFTSLHAATASQAVPRLLDEFPQSEHDQLRMALAANLQAVVCQRLVPARAGGVVPAVELLINTPTVRKLISRNQLEHLHAAIETGNEDGMQTFNQAIYRMIKDKVITEKDGMEAASQPEQLRMNLQGIFLDESRRILSTL